MIDKDLHTNTINAYNQFSDVYDEEVIDFWSNFPHSTVSAFKQSLPGSNVLNLGSGSGRDAILLRDAGCEVTCVDGSHAMIDMTNKLGFTSRQARFDELDLEDSFYDGIWAYTSLLHVSKEEAIKTLSDITPAIAANGVLMLGMIEGEFEGLVQRESMPGVDRYFKYYTSIELVDMVQPLGFKIIFEECYMPGSKRYLHQVYRKL